MYTNCKKFQESITENKNASMFFQSERETHKKKCKQKSLVFQNMFVLLVLY